MDQELSDKIELEVKRANASESQAFRKSLEDQFKLLTAGISIVLAVALAAFFYFVSDSKETIRKDMDTNIKASILAYRIEDDLMKRLDNLAKISAEKPEVKNIINAQVLSEAGKIVPNQVDNAIKLKLEHELGILNAGNLEQLIKRASDSTLKEHQDRINRVEANLNSLLPTVEKNTSMISSQAKVRWKYENNGAVSCQTYCVNEHEGFSGECVIAIINEHTLNDCNRISSGATHCLCASR